MSQQPPQMDKQLMGTNDRALNKCLFENDPYAGHSIIDDFECGTDWSVDSLAIRSIGKSITLRVVQLNDIHSR